MGQGTRGGVLFENGHARFLIPLVVDWQQRWHVWHVVHAFSIGTVKLNLDASCNENGSNLSSGETPCFWVPIIIKCNKLVMMEAQTFFDFGALTCFMDKKLV